MADNLERTLNWKQGLAIALGVPLLILPSIGTFATYLWAFAVIAWGLSVLQGFLQNMAYGEMATAFPNASGLPGFAALDVAALTRPLLKIFILLFLLYRIPSG